jgi:replicative DNA helicase
MLKTDNVKDLGAERAVLTGMFSHGEDGYLDVTDLVSGADSFTDTANQALFNIFHDMYGRQEMKRLDESSVAATAEQMGYSWLFQKPDDVNHVRTILNGRVLPENVSKWSAKVEKLSITRQLMDQLMFAGKTLEDINGDEPIEQILGMVEEPLFDFSNRLQGPSNNSPELLGVGMREHLTALMDNPVEQIGISSGYKYYDEHIGGGFRRNSVNLLGARTGVGKSMVSVNIGKHVAGTLGIPVLYLDTEMINEDHWYRVAANLSNQSIGLIETGKVGFTEAGRQAVLDACGIMEDMPFHYLNISGRAFPEIVAIMRRWVMQNVGYNEDGTTKDCLIIYDYMKLMSGDGMAAHMQEYQMLGFMMTCLHNFAVRYSLPIFSLVQLNRDGIDGEDTGVIAGSDRIAWLATNIGVFKPKSDAEMAADGGDEFGTHKIVVMKARHGGGTKFPDYINYHMEGKYAQIVELETHSNLKAKQDETFADAPSENMVDIDESEDIPV